MKKLRNVLKSCLVYFSGNVLNSLVSFLLIPIYTRFLKPSEYGQFDVIKTYLTFIASILFMQLHTVILRYMYDFEKKEKPITNAIFLMMLSTLLMGALFFLVCCFINIEYPFLVFLFGISESYANFYGAIARGYGKNILYAGSGVIATVINATLNIVLIIGLQFGYESLYIAMSISVLIQCIVIEFKLGVMKKIKIHYLDKKLLKDMLIFAIPFGTNIAAYWFLNSYSRVAITHYLGSEQNGIYAIALKFTSLLSILATCVNLVWQELAFEKGSSKNIDRIELGDYYKRASDIYLRLLYLCAIFILPIIRVLFPVFIGKEYLKGLRVIPLAIVYMLINIYCSFLTSIFSAIKKNTVMFVASCIGAIVNVIYINLFIYEQGLLAVNISMIIGFLTNAVIRVIFLKKEIGFGCNINEFIIFLFGFSIVFCIYMFGSIMMNIIIISLFVLFVIVEIIIIYRKKRFFEVI